MYYEEKFINGVLHYRTSPSGEWQSDTSARSLAANVLLGLSEEKRLSVFRLFCTHCGANDPTCKCWNDE
ncbi:hypothetical protein J2W93_002204 [Acidovorax delafieldii]|uniref:Uncharacterized protein n=1 Tax=Acidovorax delafieldii TaxID=47920 RepID=A0ABU1RF19_ACIDE|nr:hypothetical protein [Acidovorax delafieldii]